MSLHRLPHCPMQDEAQVLRSGASVQPWDACAGVGSMYLFFAAGWGEDIKLNTRHLQH